MGFDVVEQIVFCLISKIVKVVACGFVQVQNDIQTVLFSPGDGVIEIFPILFDQFSVFFFDDVEIERDAYVVKMPCRNTLEIAFGDKRFVTFTRVVALGKPTAKINTFVQLNHRKPPISGNGNSFCQNVEDNGAVLF